MNCINLKSVVFPNTLTNIGHNAFANCTNLESVGPLDFVTYITHGAFSNTGLINCDIVGKNVEYVDSACFGNSGIRSVVFPKIVTVDSQYGTVGTSNTFRSCKNLQYALFGSNCETIGWNCFGNCVSLTDFICLAVTPPTNSSGIGSSNPIASGSGTIWVPDESIETYQSATGWSEYASTIKGISSLQTDNPDLYEEVKDYI